MKLFKGMVPGIAISSGEFLYSRKTVHGTFEYVWFSEGSCGGEVGFIIERCGKEGFSKGPFKSFASDEQLELAPHISAVTLSMNTRKLELFKDCICTEVRTATHFCFAAVLWNDTADRAVLNNHINDYDYDKVVTKYGMYEPRSVGTKALHFLRARAAYAEYIAGVLKSYKAVYASKERRSA